jgi:hypothetical protein
VRAILKTTEKLAEMERQMAQLQQQLTETQNRNSYLAARAAELDVELEHAGTELQAARLAGANSEDSSQLARENELLRNIVVRERQEEARRDEAWKLCWRSWIGSKAIGLAEQTDRISCPNPVTS